MADEFKERWPTLAAFEENVRGIRNIIKAADIYALHIIADYRNTEIDNKQIKAILSSDAVSILNFDGNFYTNHEISELERIGHIKNVGQQIVLATYTALEFYLIEKFKEYYRYFFQSIDRELVINSLKRYSFRNLDEINKHYFEMLKIHLPSYDIKYFSSVKCNWQPKDSWAGIKTLEEARHQIAHTGKTEKYKIVTLMDSWYPFEFVCNWVRSFDVDFDNLIYRGNESAAIKEYKGRMVKQQRSL
jgi:hypothetical protein